jgi:hypothetical protein
LPEPETSESTTTPIGLNHRTLFSVSIASWLVNIDPTTPKMEKVINIKTNAVTEFTIIFLVLVRKVSAVPHIDFLLDIIFSPNKF